MANKDKDKAVEEVPVPEVPETPETVEPVKEETVTIASSVLEKLMVEMADLRKEVAEANSKVDANTSKLVSVGLAAREVTAAKKEPVTYEVNDGILRTDN